MQDAEAKEVFRDQLDAQMHCLWHAGLSRQYADTEARVRCAAFSGLTQLERFPLPAFIQPLLILVRWMIGRAARQSLHAAWGAGHCSREWPGWVGCTGPERTD
jgi:hypothetical protein